MSKVVEKGKELAFLLRHDVDSFEKGLIDKNGWREVSELVKHHGYTNEVLNEIVETNNKQRYEYDDQKTHIRARQGHSIPVEVELTEVVDCDILWHGTSADALNSIIREGLKPQSRLHVHLSKDKETAEKVGKRHSKHIGVIKINAPQMLKDGVKIWLSNNGVYLTKYVDTKYFIQVTTNAENNYGC